MIHAIMQGKRCVSFSGIFETASLTRENGLKIAWKLLGAFLSAEGQKAILGDSDASEGRNLCEESEST